MILFIYSTSMYYHVEKDIYNELAYYALEVLFYVSTIYFIILTIIKIIASCKNKIFIAALFMVIAIYLEMKYNFILLDDRKETIKLTVEAKPSIIVFAGYCYLVAKSVVTICQLAMETMVKPTGNRLPGYIGLLSLLLLLSGIGATFYLDFKNWNQFFDFNSDIKKSSLLDENNLSITELISNIDSWDLFVIGAKLNVNITIYCIVCLILINAIEKNKFSIDSIRPRFIRYLVDKIYTKYQNNKHILYIFILFNQLVLLFSLIMVLPLLLLN